MKHIQNGIDWKFYNDYSFKEIIKMKNDGTEESKYWVYLHKKE